MKNDKNDKIVIFIFFREKAHFPAKSHMASRAAEVAYIIKTSAKNGIIEAQESPRSGKIAPRYGGRRKLFVSDFFLRDPKKNDLSLGRKVTSDTQQISNRFRSSTMLEPMHLLRTAVTCAAGASRTLTAAEQQFRPAPQYLPADTVLDENYISTVLCPAGLSPDVSSVDTHTGMHQPSRRR